MKNKKLLVSFAILLFIFSTLTVGCSSETETPTSKDMGFLSTI